MNRPGTVIGFINAGHFIDHYSMLVFAAAVIVMGPALGISYGDLLPYATPGFVAFGAGALLTGWLGDRWSRRHMMAIFFLGIGVGHDLGRPGRKRRCNLASRCWRSGCSPRSTTRSAPPCSISHADKLGRQVGINGLWGNLGVASSAVVTGVIAQYLGWRWAFVLPGLVTIGVGIAFMRQRASRGPDRPQTSRRRRARVQGHDVARGGGAGRHHRRQFDHLQRGHRRAAKTVRRAAGRC